MKYFLLLIALLAQPLSAQVNNPTTGVTMAEVQAIVPAPSTTTPPCISDSGILGTGTPYALWNHTHCSKTRRAIVNTAADGSYTWTYATFNNPPVCQAVAEVASGVTDVVNAQIVGTPTTTTASFLVNRTQKSVVSLIGLTVLSVPASPGVTKLHLLCIEP